MAKTSLWASVLMPRFWAKVRKTADCWFWEGAKSGAGYGDFWDCHRVVAAHRFAYAAFVGVVPANMGVHHLCYEPSCVNPDHLRLMTGRQNLLDSPRTWASRNRLKTHCKHGHPLTPKNLWLGGLPRRVCKVCIRLRMRRYREIPR